MLLDLSMHYKHGTAIDSMELSPTSIEIKLQQFLSVNILLMMVMNFFIEPQFIFHVLK
jgi:hypothetical protein